MQQRPGKQLLACANTNIAVDNVVEGLILRGVRVVRTLQPDSRPADDREGRAVVIEVKHWASVDVACVLGLWVLTIDSSLRWNKTPYEPPDILVIV